MAMCLVFFSILFISTFSLLEAKHNGFSVDLIHRDSPESPVYDPSLTSSQRLTNALHRSLHRAHHISNHSHRLPKADIISDNGEYLMNISFGTPPVPTLVIADTGSDVIWTQCKPCSPCFKQTSSLFSPEKSISYKKIACNDPKCIEMGVPCSGMINKTCSYSVRYGDNSFSKGDLASDTIKLGKMSIPNIVFGCGFENGGIFSTGCSGIVGLGSGNLSLITQMRSTIQGKFSYCLDPLTSKIKSSKINFGHNALVSSDKGAPVVTTPISTIFPNTFYFLTLEGLSVGTERFDNYNLDAFGDPLPVDEGNIVIDSGATLTLLNSNLYNKLVDGVTKQIKKKTVDSPSTMLSVCYKSLSDEEIPEITMHFKNADVKLKSYNTFVEIKKSIKCLAFKEIDNVAVYGNIAQSNFLIGYDLEKKTVSFKPTDCTKL